MSDFLSIDAGNQAQLALRQQAIEYAQLYAEAFVHNPAGRRLLADWDRRLGQKRVAVNAPHTEYAAVEAVRSFIADIHAQITLAQTEGK